LVLYWFGSSSILHGRDEEASQEGRKKQFFFLRIVFGSFCDVSEQHSSVIAGFSSIFALYVWLISRWMSTVLT
jgi:hypothetical protein